MSSMQQNWIRTNGVVRLEDKDGQFVGRWGIGRPDVAQVTLDAGSSMRLKEEGFYLLNLKVYPDNATALARPEIDEDRIQAVIDGLQVQLENIEKEDFLSEAKRASTSVVERYNYGKPVAVILEFKRQEGQLRQEGDPVPIFHRCFHGYGLKNDDDIGRDNKPTTFGSKIKGIGGVIAGWQMVVMFPTDPQMRRFLAIPLTESKELIQMAIDSLTKQVKLAKRFAQERKKEQEKAIRHAKSVIKKADIG